MSIEENIARIRTRIAAAAERCGRDPSGIELLAVSKGQSVQAVTEAAAAGLLLFGESKVQEAKVKIPQGSTRLRWHMIGHLQTNKARDAVQLFQCIESVDSLKLAEELQHWAEKLSRTVSILVEVNAAGESSKFGYAPDRLKEELLQLNAFDRLEIYGLMTIAPWSQDPEKVRPHFRRVRQLKEECEQILGVPLRDLSMGMSGDFEVAIEEGSTRLRIGTALFGPRRYAPKAPAD